MSLPFDTNLFSANANVLAATKMRQMRLAITWGHSKIAREFIFSQKLYKFSVQYGFYIDFILQIS